MRRMGGLKRALPTTYWTFLVATLAISGVPLLSGFFSKDEILHQAFAGGHYVLWLVALVTAGLTAGYMFRAVFMTFHGSFRGTDHQREHLHESPPVMTLPLVVLAVGAVLAGYVGVPAALSFHRLDLNVFDKLLEPVLTEIPGLGAEYHHLSLATEWLLIALSVGVAAVGILAAWRLYGRDRGLAGGEALAARFPAVHRVLVGKYFVDELYDKTVVAGTWATARSLFRFDATVIDGVGVNGTRHATVATALVSGFFDKYVVDGLVNLVGTLLAWGSGVFRRLQTGLVSQYAMVMAVGMFVLVCFFVFMRLG